MPTLIVEVSPPRASPHRHQPPDVFLKSTPVRLSIASQLDIPTTTTMLQEGKFLRPAESGDETMAMYCERTRTSKRRKIEIVQPPDMFTEVVRHAEGRGETRMQSRMSEMEAEMQVSKAEMQVTKAEMQVTKAEMQVTKAEMQVTKAEMQVTKAEMQAIKEQLGGVQMLLDIQFDVYASNLALDFARKMDELMSKRSPGKAKAQVEEEKTHDNASLVRFVAQLTANDLAKFDVPSKFLKCLAKLEKHREDRNTGVRETKKPFAAMLHAGTFDRRHDLHFWRQLFEFVYDEPVEKLAEDFRKTEF
ncbi:MAG: hypothetical protein M1838_004583 [Thelocarpon superellum]|nr:MAG: hypothetical protein M1838_004583 [Thelocarpon superellum]